MLIKNGPLVCQNGLLANPVKQMDTQLLLKLLDLNGDGGLGVAKGFCRFGKAFLAAPHGERC